MTGKPSVRWTQFVTGAALLLPSDTAFSHQCGVASCLQQACRILDAVRTFSAEQEIHWGVLSDLGASRSGSGSCKRGWSWHAPKSQALHVAHPMYQQLICKLHFTVSGSLLNWRPQCHRWTALHGPARATTKLAWQIIQDLFCRRCACCEAAIARSDRLSSCSLHRR